jgi:hypothetical protein
MNLTDAKSRPAMVAAVNAGKLVKAVFLVIGIITN